VGRGTLFVHAFFYGVFVRGVGGVGEGAAEAGGLGVEGLHGCRSLFLSPFLCECFCGARKRLWSSCVVGVVARVCVV
jgi:hypothetical protein